MAAFRGVLSHPEEIPALVKMKLQMRQVKKQIPHEDSDVRFCYEMLQRVSRSFALVIQQLGPDLRDAICVFYLVLRGLDTIEDDMSIDVDTKLPLLKAMHKYIYDSSWRFSCGEKNYKILMDNFPHVSLVFLRLGKRYQDAIEDGTNKMGHGMAKFICQEVETIEDYNEYCHYVAGLVGIGLSELFFASGLEELAPETLSNSMGLFLQKTNIIRDYLEDINELPKPRMFWPREIWGKHALKLEEFKAEENSERAVACLNEMITNALEHAMDCLKYLSALRDPAIFRFCAIPQIMAIGTLAECYNNVGVFRGVVKIRRGLTARIMDETQNMADVYGAFYDFSSMLADKVNKRDACATLTLDRANAIQQVCRDSHMLIGRRSFSVKSRLGHEVLLAITLLIVFLAMLYSVQK